MPADDEEFTIEGLREIFRRERQSKRVTEIRPDFYRVAIERMDQYKKTIAREFSIDGYSPKARFASAQLKDLKGLTQEIFKFRYKKINALALRTATDGKIDTKVKADIRLLTPEELDYFNTVVETLKNKYDYISRVDDESTISISGRAEYAVPVTAEDVKPADISPADAVPSDTLTDDLFSEEVLPGEPSPEEDLEGKMPSETVSAPAPQESDEAEETKTIDAQISGVQILVRILENIPDIAGIDRDYRLKKEDIVTLPATIAKILISQKAALPISTELID